MDAIETLMKAMDALGRELDAEHLRPDPTRKDWDTQRENLADARRTIEEEILPFVDEAALVLGDPEAGANLRNNTAGLVGELAAITWAAHREDESARLFRAALALQPSGPLLAELEAGRREPASFTQLALTRWQLRNRNQEAADALLKELKRSAREPAIKVAVKRLLDRPRPITGAPPLFRVNGFGASLYGARDHAPDGSHVATYCVSALFFPVLPLSAYRVIDHGGGRYSFLAKEKLSAFARTYQFAVLIAVLGAIGWAGLSSWLDSPEHRARVAFEDAQALEARQPDRALVAYRRLVDDPSVPDELVDRAGDSIVRLAIAQVDDPITIERVDEGVRAARAFTELPARARGSARTRMERALVHWAEQIGDTNEPAQRAGLRLLDSLLAPGEAPLGPALALHRRLGAELADDWPIEALQHFLLARDHESLERARALATSMEAQPSLLMQAEPDVRALHRAGADELAPGLFESARARIDAWHADTDRERALNEGDAAVLAQIHAREPADQEVAVALAQAKRAAGELAEARSILTSYGPPGRLIDEGQRALAGCMADADQLAEADALLSHQVDARLPAFLEIQRAYSDAISELQRNLISRAQLGLEPELDSRVRNLSDEQARAVVQDWLTERIRMDDRLTRMRERYGEQAPIVGAVLALGTIKLRRARAASGEERRQLLDQAERLFLAIRDEAEGVPTYHLSLGQVYYRLGRSADGERELASVLAGPDSELHLAVAHAYRELGLEQRAREVATQVYEANRGQSSAQSQQLVLGAVLMMVRLASRLEDREMWLRRAPQDNDAIQTDLLHVQGERAQREGRLADADRLFAQVAERYDRVTHDAAAQNNAALARVRRYLCTGDIAQVDRAVTQLESAMRMLPDNSLAVGNLSGLLNYRAQLRVLSRVVRVSVLRVDAEEARNLIGAFHLRDAFREDPAVARARELDRQEMALAPQRTDAYLRQFRLSSSGHDLAALQALQSQLRDVSGLDTTSYREERERYERGEGHEQLEADLDHAVSDTEAMVDAARRAHDPATLAAALIALADALESRALVSTRLADAERSLASLREAQTTFPSIDVRSAVANALVTVALLRALPASSALAAAWREEGRRLPPSIALSLASERDPALTANLRPALLEAAHLRDAESDSELSVDDIPVGRLAGDDALVRRALANAHSEESQIELALGELLEPAPVWAQRRALITQAQ